MTLLEIRRIYMLECIFKKYINKVLLIDNEIYVYVAAEEIVKLSSMINCSILFSIETLQDLVAVDNISSITRFELYYNFFSYRYNYRLFFVVNLISSKLEHLFRVPSITVLFKSADWLEREVYDMFGLFFYEHDDLRRILTDYGFNGFPLRKDFPLSGFKEVRYDETLKLIINDKVKLAQEFRNFSNN